MKKDELERKIDSVLNEEETFMLSLILLAQLHEDDKYRNLSELIFLFDNYDGFKQFIKFYEGQTIQVPTIRELKQSLRLLELFQKVKIDKKDFDEYYDKLKMSNLDLSKGYCEVELEKFSNYLKENGTGTLKQLRKLSKK